MKKGTKKSVTAKTPGLNKSLIEGAELLITEIKTPASCLILCLKAFTGWKNYRESSNFNLNFFWSALF